MLELSCLCGQAVVQAASKPAYVHECNCALCRKTGARWAYFHPSEVEVAGETQGYCRADKPDPNAEIRFCAICGATTHFVLTAGAQARFGNSLMGVNVRLVDEQELAGIELRFPDGQAWPG